MGISRIKTQSLALSSVNSDIILNNTVKFVDLNSEVSNVINDTYTTVQSNSANWQQAYTFVGTNSANLTITNSVSSKYYYGTLIDWMTLIRGYNAVPTLLQTIAGGDVYTYTYSTTGTDKTYYRYIANDGSEDSFYSNFTGGTLNDLVAKKTVIL